jgi:hypothetical protein
MLASPRLETGMRACFDDMLGCDDFAVLAKDPDISSRIRNRRCAPRASACQRHLRVIRPMGGGRSSSQERFAARLGLLQHLQGVAQALVLDELSARRS